MVLRIYLVASALMLMALAWADYHGYTPFGSDEVRNDAHSATGARVFHK